MKKFKGFTLVEVLIVIIIIGILIAALLPRLVGAQATARDTGRKADVKNVATAAQLYYAQNGEYPTGGCLTASHILVGSGFLSSMPTEADTAVVTQGCTGLYFATGTDNVFNVYATVEESGNGNISAVSSTGSQSINDSGSLYVVSVQ